MQCGAVCEGVQCSVRGECNKNPETGRASKHGIFCAVHAREDGRTAKGRNSELRDLVMCKSLEDKKRARAEAERLGKEQRKKKKKSPAEARRESVSTWLGPRSFKECSVFHSKMVLDELRVPPLLLGDDQHRTRVYLRNDFALDDLQYLYKKRRKDGRMLFFVRGSSIIRCDIISVVGVAWFVFLKH